MTNIHCTANIPKCKCGHDKDDHEAVGGEDGYPHDWEQFCMGGDEDGQCDCNHYEEAE